MVTTLRGSPLISPSCRRRAGSWGAGLSHGRPPPALSGRRWQRSGGISSGQCGSPAASVDRTGHDPRYRV